MAGRLRKPRAGRPLKLTAMCGAWLCAWSALGPGGLVAGPPATLARTTARPAAAAPLGGINVAGLGPSSTLTDADRSVARARALHAQIVRLGVPWSALQPRGPGQVDDRAQAFLDRLTADAAAAGIGVVMMVDSTPCWASSAPSGVLRRCTPTTMGAANAWPPRNAGDYATIVGYLAARYGPRLAAIEVWNEPDQANQLYFAGPEKPQRYAAILRAAYPAIKQADPNVTVLGGSLVGSNGVFLRALYAAGAKGYYDGLAVHFYNLTLGSLRAIHETQLANGDRAPLWLDEFGWSSCWPRQRTQQEQACVTPRVQAQNVTNVFRSLARTPYVAAEALYDLRGTRAEDFGVLDERGARKPAWSALARVLSNPFASPGGVTLQLGVRHGAVVARGGGPVGDYMQLEASRGGVLRYRALFTLDRSNRYAIPLPRALGRTGLTVRVFQFWAGRARGAQRSI